MADPPCWAIPGGTVPGGAVKGFPVSKLGQVRSGRASWGTLALFIPLPTSPLRLLEWRNQQRRPGHLAQQPPGCTQWKPCPSMAENCSLTARVVGPEAGAGSTSLRSLGPRHFCSSGRGCGALGSQQSLPAFIFPSANWGKHSYQLPGWWGGLVESGFGRGKPHRHKRASPALLTPNFTRQSPWYSEPWTKAGNGSLQTPGGAPRLGGLRREMGRGLCMSSAPVVTSGETLPSPLSWVPDSSPCFATA